jgi:hypothetical protein
MDNKFCEQLFNELEKTCNNNQNQTINKDNNMKLCKFYYKLSFQSNCILQEILKKHENHK